MKQMLETLKPKVLDPFNYPFPKKKDTMNLSTVQTANIGKKRF